MTGTVVYLTLRGGRDFGEIVAPGIDGRIPFCRRDVRGAAFCELLARQVDFDLAHAAGGRCAVHVRPTKSPPRD
jgi:hypothetical protein